METFTMSRKELPRVGLVQAAWQGGSPNREGAAALRVTPRQFQRLQGALSGGRRTGLFAFGPI